MRVVYTEQLLDNFVDAPVVVQRAFDKQMKFLANNLHHPSLHAKKYDEAKNIWQGRVNLGWRFYFSIEGDKYIIRNLISHPK